MGEAGRARRRGVPPGGCGARRGGRAVRRRSAFDLSGVGARDRSTRTDGRPRGHRGGAARRLPVHRLEEASRNAGARPGRARRIRTRGASSPASPRAWSAAAGAVAFARDLVNTPADELTPTRFAELAAEHGAEQGFSVSVWDERADRRRRPRGSPRRGAGLGGAAAARARRVPAGRPRGADRRARRQGDHLRLRGPVAEAGRVDDDDEVRHERRRRGARRRSARAGDSASASGSSASCR